jgi:guanylate kinase
MVYSTGIFKGVGPQLRRCFGHATVTNVAVNGSPVLLHQIMVPLRFSTRRLSCFRSTTAMQMEVSGDKLPYWKNDDGKGDDKGQRVIAPLVVCGPSGVGTRAIIKRFLMDYGDKFVSIVSHTTRKPYEDEGEINGIDYYFVSEIRMNEMIVLDAFFEWAEVHGHLFGMTFESIFDALEYHGLPRCEIMDIDMQGVKNLKSIAITFGAKSTRCKLRPKYVFIAPPDLETLKYRLIARDTESEEEIRRRLHAAKKEIEYGKSIAFDAVVYHFDLDQAVRDFTDTVKRLYNNFDTAIAEDVQVDRLGSNDRKFLPRNPKPN